MSSRWTGFFVWALVAASTAFWGIKIFAATRPVPPGAQAPQVVAANGPMERLFGAVVVPTIAPPPQHPESERFQLVGVIAPPGATQGGFAVIALDGQPARTWRVGSVVDGNTALLSVSKRGAEFGPPGGPTAFTLQLPEPAAAETGTLPPATSQPDAAQLQNGGPRSPQFDNAQHVAQPPSPMIGRGGFQGGPGARSAVPQPPGRGGFQPGNGRLAVPHMETPGEQTQNDSGAEPQPQQQ
jgi:general secretion pathway protein C